MKWQWNTHLSSLRDLKSSTWSTWQLSSEGTIQTNQTSSGQHQWRRSNLKKKKSVNPPSHWNSFCCCWKQKPAPKAALHLQDTVSEKFQMTLHCSLHWLKAFHQESHPWLSSGQQSYTWPGMVWMDEDCIVPCFSCISKLTFCLNFCRKEIPWLCLCLSLPCRVLPSQARDLDFPR